MLIGILQTGQSPDALRAGAGDYPDMFARLLAGPHERPQPPGVAGITRRQGVRVQAEPEADAQRVR